MNGAEYGCALLDQGLSRSHRGVGVDVSNLFLGGGDHALGLVDQVVHQVRSDAQRHAAEVAHLCLSLHAALVRGGQSIIVVMASFGASMALRSLLEFMFTSRPTYFSRAIQIAQPVGLGIRVTADQVALLLLTLALVIGMHLFMQRSQRGREMRDRKSVV